MKKKFMAAVLAAVTLCAGVSSQATLGGILAAGSYDIEVSVDVSGYRKAISPYIYGVNSQFRSEEYLYNAEATSARQGGNRFSGYNWETNYSNAGRDWLHNSDEYLVDFDKELLAIPGAPAIGFAQEAAAKNVPYKITTLQMAGYVAADADGEVTEEEIAPSDRWIEVKAAKGSEFSMTPDTTDGYVYMDEYVNYLVETLGDAATETGYQAYHLDNEPGIWDGTHARMHPEETTCEEIVTKSIEYSAAVKAVDPNAEIFGLSLFGMGAYTSFSGAPDWSEHADEYDWFISYYLDEMAKAEEEHGQRLIDVIDVHYYSEAKGQCRVTECEDYTHTDCIEARLQSPRTLYDPMYIEDSWIGEGEQEYLPIFPSIWESIDTYYPGTKLALTEYNFGGGNHISGAVAQADALGVFAENDVYVSNLWAVNSNFDYQLSAIDLYTNYDGNGSSFGDTLVQSDTSDIEKATSYAAIDGTDESRVTLVLTNKSLTDTQNATITLNSGADYSSAKVYGITGDSSEIQLLQTVSNIEQNCFTLSIPALSVVQIEINADDYTMLGDVNTDGTVDALDVEDLNEYLAVKPDTAISLPHAELIADGTVNVFDLSALKGLLAEWSTPPETEPIVAFWWTKTGQWRIKNGMGGETVTLVFGGEAGNKLNLGYGYWDPVTVNPDTGNAGIWIHNDDTKLGKYTFDENGEARVTFTIPENASSVEIITYNYTDESSGTVVQLDKSLFTLDKVLLS
ncbi:MAG: hypothetical protein IJ496_09840 [Ruminococcus sp.]|nr:hypothetical protein [Ruminococcus sp.]